MSGDRQTPAQEQAAGTTGATAAAVTPPGKPAIRLSGRLARFLQTDLASQLDPAVQATVLLACLHTVGCIPAGRPEPGKLRTVSRTAPGALAWAGAEEHTAALQPRHNLVRR